MPIFSIRLALPADAPEFAAILRKSWIFAYSPYVPMEIIEQRNAHREEMWEIFLKANFDTHYAAVSGGKIIGILSINPPRDQDLPATVYELTGLYLDPDFIGKGLGQKTMDWVKKEIIARGYRTISLWVLAQNSRAKTFYEKNGFQPDGTVKASGLGNLLEERYLCYIQREPG